MYSDGDGDQAKRQPWLPVTCCRRMGDHEYFTSIVDMLYIMSRMTCCEALKKAVLILFGEPHAITTGMIEGEVLGKLEEVLHSVLSQLKGLYGRMGGKQLRGL